MRRWLADLRQRPKAVRDRYAFYVAGGATLVVCMLWLASMPSKFAVLGEEPQADNDERGGFSRAWDDIRGQFALVVDSYEEIVSSEEIPEAVPPVAESSSNQLDVAALAQPPEDAAQTAPVVLIATTSASTTASDADAD